MKKFLELNTEIENLYKPNIHIFNNYQNILFQNTWVNEVYHMESYFHDWEERIKEKINNISDPDSAININFIKVFHQDVLKKYNDLNKTDYESLEYLKSFPQFPVTFCDATNPSKTKNREFYYHPDNHYQYENFIEKMARIFKIDDFYFDDDHTDYDGVKDILEDEILFKLKANESELEKFYSLGFLSYCLDSTKTILKNISKYLDSFVNLIKKLENYKQDEFTLDEVFDNDPNNIKLEHKLSKMEVALFYRALHDTGIIHVNNQGQKYPYSNLKKYIDKSNMYYLNNTKVEKIKNTSKEFAKFLNDNKYEKHELKVLNLIVEKFNYRIEHIKANHEDGLA